MRIPLGNGQGFALIDDADAALVTGYHWHLHRRPNTNYAKASRTTGRRQQPYMHVLILGQRGVDHINGDGLDNRRANLRKAGQVLNLANQRPQVGRSSRYKGVSWYVPTRRWRASIKTCGRQRHLGYFDQEADAARAYDRAALDAWGEYARLNFPR